VTNRCALARTCCVCTSSSLHAKYQHRGVTDAHPRGARIVPPGPYSYILLAAVRVSHYTPAMGLHYAAYGRRHIVGDFRGPLYPARVEYTYHGRHDLRTWASLTRQGPQRVDRDFERPLLPTASRDVKRSLREPAVSDPAVEPSRSQQTALPHSADQQLKTCCLFSAVAGVR